ncbi:MAG: amidohydrolase family protein [Thermodesulfobacteriota bacterium]
MIEKTFSIIDAHAHLGDILHLDGGRVIDAGPVQKTPVADIISLSEAMGHRMTWYRDHVVFPYFKGLIVLAETARNATASLANLSASMDRNGIGHTVCLPIFPYVTFDDLAAARRKDSRIIPFTTMDCSLAPDKIAVALEEDVAAGARGLKLHPIIQREPLSSAKTLAAVETVAAHGLPVLVHTGISSYYPAGEPGRQTPANADIPFVEELVSRFPGVSFVAGHAGLYQTKAVMARLSKYANVRVDVSFQSSGTVKKLIAAFGPERVLFGSDWPFGNPEPMVKIVKAACRSDAGLARCVFYDNAAQLLGL